MINLYHVPFTRAFRVIWVCEELAIPYRLTPVDFSPEYRASAEWRKLNPVGKVPVMTDGDLTMFESGAMVQYVLDRYGNGRLQPEAGTPEHAIYLQWSWFAEATFSRPIGETVNHRRAFAEPIQAVLDEMIARARLALAAVDQALAGRPYLLGGEFSAADIMTGYTVMLAERAIKTGLPERAADYWQRLQARAAFKATKAAEQAMGKD
ncbi:MAG: glutathione S-transferase [Gammaproteobacteria bacterium]|nr:glutathione S-transferase [Gammaproteobacteria bacterium]